MGVSKLGSANIISVSFVWKEGADSSAVAIAHKNLSDFIGSNVPIGL